MASLNDLLSHLRDRGIDPDSTDVVVDEESGIATFLLYNLSGQMVGYQRYNPKGDKKDHSNSLAARYYTYVTKESEKSSKIAVWGLQYVNPKDDHLFVTEGIFDAVKVKNAGQPVIAVLGNNPKPLKAWFSAMSKKVIAILDNDDAGSALTKFADYAVKVPEPYKDLGDMPQVEANQLIEKTMKEAGIQPKKRNLFIFDFDDTLAKTNSRIKVRNPKKGEFMMTPAEYAVYKPDPQDEFDYSEFDELIEPKELPKYVRRLKSAIKTGQDVAIVTARGSEKPVAQFLKNVGVTHGVKIAAVASSDPKKKTDYIERKLAANNYSDVVMYDDAPKNIETFKSLQKKYPNILFHGHHVPHHHDTKAKSKDRSGIDKVLNSKIKNPETDNDILVKTALRYDKNHPARRVATQMVKKWYKK
jgi:hypothetical protein